MGYGGFLWISMICRMSFNNKRKHLVKFFFIVMIIINLGILIYEVAISAKENLQDSTWWADFSPYYIKMMILITISTTLNGIFFTAGSFYAYSFAKENTTF